MSSDDYKNPSKFPAYFHAALKSKPGVYLIGARPDLVQIHRLRRQFRAFVRSMKMFRPQELEKRIGNNKELRLSIEPSVLGFNMYLNITEKAGVTLTDQINMLYEKEIKGKDTGHHINEDEFISNT